MVGKTTYHINMVLLKILAADRVAHHPIEIVLPYSTYV